MDVETLQNKLDSGLASFGVTDDKKITITTKRFDSETGEEIEPMVEEFKESQLDAEIASLQAEIDKRIAIKAKISELN